MDYRQPFGSPGLRTSLSIHEKPPSQDGSSRSQKSSGPWDATGDEKSNRDQSPSLGQREQSANESNGAWRRQSKPSVQNPGPNESTDLTWGQRIQHVTWAWFTLTMATGGLANVIGSVPYSFNGQHAIGTTFFLLTLVCYIIIWAMMLTRFVMYPHMFFASLIHPTESLFVPAFAVSWGTLLINMTDYGSGYTGEWLTQALLVLYWFNVAFSFILSLSVYLTLWSSQTFTLDRMTPIWIFPAYPLLIIGTHAGALSGKLSDPRQAIQVIVGGCTLQGIGFLVSLTIYSAYVYRLFTHKIPVESLRPGMFVSVGPSAFTVSGMLKCVMNLPDIVAATPEANFLGVPGELAAQILRVSVSWFSLWVWGLAWWFFFVSLASNIDCLRKKHRVPFSMPWFSFVFPQTALTAATFAIASSFEIEALKILGCVLTCLLVVVWLLVVGSMFKAIADKQILWPEKGEDRTEGNFQPDKVIPPLVRISTSGLTFRGVKKNFNEDDSENRGQ